MSELIDKLERAAKGAAQPLGFGGAARRERVAPLLLLAVVDSGVAAQAKTAVGAGVDAAIVQAASSGAASGAAKSLPGLTFGVALDAGEPKDAAGADFQVFASHDTPLAALGGDERTIVMRVAPDLDDGLLRALNTLPVDAFLVSLADADALTVGQLMRLGRVRSATSRWLIAELAALPTKEEAEQLRDAGVSAVAVSVKGVGVKALRATREMLLDLPRESEKKKQRDRGGVALGRPPRGAGAAPPSPEPDDDDDDYDDE